MPSASVAWLNVTVLPVTNINPLEDGAGNPLMNNRYLGIGAGVGTCVGVGVEVDVAVGTGVRVAVGLGGAIGRGAFVGGGV